MIEVEGMRNPKKIVQSFLRNNFQVGADKTGMASIRRGTSLAKSAENRLIQSRQRLSASKSPKITAARRKELQNLANI